MVIFSDIALVAHCYSIEPVEDLVRFVKSTNNVTFLNRKKKRTIKNHSRN